MSEDIVPDGINLEARKKQRVHTRQDATRRHKPCGYSALEPRTGGIQNNDTGDWYCPYCEERVTQTDIYHGTFAEANE